MNYQGKPRDVMTLAHELGHGVHQVLAAKNGALMAPTPLTLAETASVFGEMLTFKRLLSQTRNAKQRQALLAGKVEDMINTVVRQIAFYSFERAVHTERKNGELTAERIGQLWLSVQGESLGPAIEIKPGYETFWMYIPHFIHSPFYVYAYAFGDCLVNSLYAVYEHASEGFAERYLDMLAAGGTKHYSELLRPFGLEVKATEGTTYTSSAFDSQYIGSYQAGMTRGAYHFAVPTRTSTGAAQADYFVDNGGGWSADGRTLPGLLDIEYNPYPAYGNICFNLSQSEMVNWIESFSNRYEKRTGRLPAIYSTTDWWATCTGNTARFNDHPLMIARWTGSPGVMPNGWSTYDIWQYSETGPFSGDSNVFGGSAAKLRDLAINPNYRPIGGKAPTTAPTTAGPFRDVSASNQFATEITWAKNKKYLNGWSDGTYRPTENIDRNAMAAVAYRMAGSPAYTPPKVSPYKDVSPSSAFYKEITWARSKGLLTGWSDGTFRPLNDIDRNATAALLYRMSGSPAYTAPKTSSFKDVRPGSAFYKEIHWMSAQGITTGWNDGTFRPLDQTHRDAMAAFLYRFAN